MVTGKIIIIIIIVFIIIKNFNFVLKILFIKIKGSSVNHPYLQSNDNNLKDSKISSELLKSHLPIKSSNEEFLCPEEELDLKLIYSGDWDEPKESPLLFLQRGFRELIKCRQILKGSFPLSFYMMPNDSADRRWNR